MEAERVSGIGRTLKRNMIRKWKAEGQGKSLKQWAHDAQVGEAALAWIEHKRSKK